MRSEASQRNSWADLGQGMDDWGRCSLKRWVIKKKFHSIGTQFSNIYIVVGVSEDFFDVGMIVAEWYGRNLHVHIEQIVSIRVSDVVAVRFIVIGKESNSSSLLQK